MAEDYAELIKMHITDAKNWQRAWPGCRIQRVEFHKNTADALTKLVAERNAAIGILAGIAKQRLWIEMSEEDQENADWTEGYEKCVRRARAALKVAE